MGVKELQNAFNLVAEVCGSSRLTLSEHTKTQEALELIRLAMIDFVRISNQPKEEPKQDK